MGLEERRGFVSKGIPIIFAEELEERPSSRHPAKAPVILKVIDKVTTGPADDHVFHCLSLSFLVFHPFRGSVFHPVHTALNQQ